MKNIILKKVLKEITESKKEDKLKAALSNFHIADIAEVLDYLELPERKKIYNILECEDLAVLIVEISSDKQEELIQSINTKRLRSLLEEMSNDDIVDVFGELGEQEVNYLKKFLDDEEREEVEMLSSHKSDTAGGLMTTEYFWVNTGTRIKDVIMKLKRGGKDLEIVYYVYVVEENNKLIGVATLRDLVTNNQEMLIDNVIEGNIISVEPEEDQEVVASYFSKYDLIALPVVNKKKEILGVITVDDIIDVIEEEATEDIYTMAGLVEEEQESIFKLTSSVKSRLPWLTISLCGELISASIMRIFGHTLNQLIALAFFVPLIMAMGGNSGNQSAAIVVRKIALGEVDRREIKKLIKKETISGVILGIIFGIIVGCVAYYWKGDYRLSIIIGVSLLVAVTFAAVFGIFIPLIFEKFDIDPAIASSPLISTMNDVGGILIYFSLATILLNILGGA